MTFFVPTAWAFQQRHGQVPKHDPAESAGIMKLVTQPAPPFSVDRLFERPVMTPRAAVDDLGLSKADQNSWATFLGDVVGSARYEPTVRQQVAERLMQEAWDPSLRRVVMQRAAQLFRDTGMRKSAKPVPKPGPRAPVITAAELKERLKKAEAKGGLYHRRVPKSGGGFKYYYDPKSYNESRGAHHDGAEMRKYAMGSEVTKAATTAGHEGCDAKTMRRLAKKYGRAELADHLKSSCKSGKLVYKGKRFYLGKK